MNAPDGFTLGTYESPSAQLLRAILARHPRGPVIAAVESDPTHEGDTP